VKKKSIINLNKKSYEYTKSKSAKEPTKSTIESTGSTEPTQPPGGRRIGFVINVFELANSVSKF
tara:strand:- start:293 stop:484 length:192 start_codon:yes stop_codon:yes gene_type:complete